MVRIQSMVPWRLNMRRKFLFSSYCSSIVLCIVVYRYVWICCCLYPSYPLYFCGMLLDVGWWGFFLCFEFFFNHFCHLAMMFGTTSQPPIRRRQEKFLRFTMYVCMPHDQITCCSVVPAGIMMVCPGYFFMPCANYSNQLQWMDFFITYYEWLDQ